MNVAAIAHPPTSVFPSVSAVTVTFSPKGDAETLVVAAVQGAQHTLHVQAYEFSSAAICDAIVAAHQRGVVVSVVVDKRNLPSKTTGKYSSAIWAATKVPALIAAGIQVLVDSSPTIAHSKIIIVDGAEVVTGSFNFSHAAQTTNAENLLVIKDQAVASAYEQNFAWRSSLSKPAV